MNTRQFAVSAKMWYSGSAVMMNSFLAQLDGPIHACRLLHVGDDVAVGQHRALGHAGGAAGVLQEGEVLLRVADHRQLVHAAQGAACRGNARRRGYRSPAPSSSRT
jgi:hypothetical protein